VNPPNHRQVHAIDGKNYSVVGPSDWCGPVSIHVQGDTDPIILPGQLLIAIARNSAIQDLIGRLERRSDDLEDLIDQLARCLAPDVARQKDADAALEYFRARGFKPAIEYFERHGPRSLRPPSTDPKKGP
jgi:hypothetical protein